MIFDDDTDYRLRQEINNFLIRESSDQEHPISKDALLYDFDFEGKPFKIIDRQSGIRKPAGSNRAFSITTYDTNKKFNYSDGVGSDGFIRYSWQGERYENTSNIGIRELIGTGLTIPWFLKVANGEFQPIFPLVVVGEEVHNKQFILSFVDTAEIFQPASAVESALRRYVLQTTKMRVHQRFFRSTVLAAYEDHCAVCNLHHRDLLDASHIIPDSEGGDPTVRNGLSLCKIHHRAYDVKILGITPDYKIRIRNDILLEQDGPMLQHGLKELHGSRLMHLPRRRSDLPSRDLLAIQYEKFKSA